MSSSKRIKKPAELTKLITSAPELFELLKRWSAVPDQIAIDLRAIDTGVESMQDPMMVTAFALRRLQAIYFAAQDGVVTRTDICIQQIVGMDASLDGAFDRRTEAIPRSDLDALSRLRHDLDMAAQKLMELGSDEDGGVVELH